MSEGSKSKSGSSAKAASRKSATKKAAKPAKPAKKSASTKKAASKPAKKSESAEKPAAKPADSTPRKKSSAVAKPARSGSKKPQRILRIRLRSFDYKQIDTASEVILRTVRQTGSDIRGPIPLPISRERYDLLRSPHVFKDSREQIEIRTYHRLVDILEPSKKTVDAMVKIELPNGVDANMKLI